MLTTAGAIKQLKGSKPYLMENKNFDRLVSEVRSMTNDYGVKEDTIRRVRDNLRGNTIEDHKIYQAVHSGLFTNIPGITDKNT